MAVVALLSTGSISAASERADDPRDPGVPSAAGGARATPEEHAVQVVAGFVEFVQQHESYPAAAKSFIAQEWERRRQDRILVSFIPEALAVLHPRFQDGLRAYEAKEFDYCAKIMGELSLSSNRYLAGHAAWFQVRALIEETRLEFAAMLLNYYCREDVDLAAACLGADEMSFLHGYALYHTFQSGPARDALEQFMSRYPQAAPDLRVAAREMLQDLSNPRPKNLDTVAHLMADAGLWLTEGQTGLDTQTRQRKALLILEDMMLAAQQQEQQQQRSRSSANQQGTQQRQRPTSPASESIAPEGQAARGQLHTAPTAAPGEVWGQMRPQERARILQALQNNFPSRYRELVEQYYSTLAKEE